MGQLFLSSMLLTFESRWFRRGELPETARDWFDRSCPGQWLGTEPERQDWYFRVAPSSDYLNLKLREGRLELKWRVAELGVVPLGETWVGKVERWAKWPLEDPTGESFAPEAIASGSWVAASKRRSARRLTFAGDRSCNVELTRIRVGSEPWWSLAFEAEGDDPEWKAPFLELAASVARTAPELRFTAEEAIAYPRWLASLS